MHINNYSTIHSSVHLNKIVFKLNMLLDIISETAKVYAQHGDLDLHPNTHPTLIIIFIT